MIVPKNKKGWFFTIDALIFATIIFTAIFLYTYEPPRVLHTVNHQYLADDLLGIMSKQVVSDLPNDIFEKYEYNITDVEFRVIEQLGQWWANDDVQLVHDFFLEYTDGLIPEQNGYAALVNGDIIFSSTSPQPRQVSSGKRIVTGVQKLKPIKGVVANARATRITKNSTMLVAMQPQGTGWGTGWSSMTKTFSIPSNITITNAEMVVSVHTDLHVDSRQFTVNGCSLTIPAADYLYGTDGDVGMIDITHCLQSGDNVWTMLLRNTNYNAHSHPGSYIRIDYTREEIIEQEILTKDVHKRFHFDRVESIYDGSSATGVWTTVPFFIPPDADNVGVDIYVKAENVKDYTTSSCSMWYHIPSFIYCQWFWDGASWQLARNFDYQMFLNQGTAHHIDPTPSSTAEYYYGTGDVGHLLIDGTNTLTVYFNTYGDFAWNDQTMWISDESYIDLTYTIPIDTQPFGHVEISQAQEFGGPPEDDKTTSFAFPAQANYISDAQIYLIQRYSYWIDVWAGQTNPPSELVYTSPASRAVPGEIFVSRDHLATQSTVTNFIRVRDQNAGNEILGESQILYTFSIPSQVGFGEVFAEEEDAVADAINRLQDRMGVFIDATQIETNVNAITNVPSLWGPAIIEVRVWQ